MCRYVQLVTFSSSRELSYGASVVGDIGLPVGLGGLLKWR